MSFVPLMGKLEVMEWDNRIQRAHEKRHDQDRDSYKRDRIVQAMRRARIIELAKERPHEYLANLIVLISSHGTAGQVDLEATYSDFNSDAVSKWNTEEGRWWTDKFLEAVENMPNNYAMSAASRYLKGTGKQAGIKKPGVGLMSVDSGWKSSEVQMITSIFFSGTFGAPCYDPEYIGMYSDYLQDNNFTEEEKDSLWEGNPFAHMRAEKDLEFIAELRRMLTDLGMKAPPARQPKVQKPPRKVKNFKVGDSITKSNLRDLPDGTVIINTSKPAAIRCGTPDGAKYGWQIEQGTTLCSRCKEDPNFAHPLCVKGMEYHKLYTWHRILDKSGKIRCVVEDPKPKRNFDKFITWASAEDLVGFTVVSLPSGY